MFSHKKKDIVELCFGHQTLPFQNVRVLTFLTLKFIIHSSLVLYITLFVNVALKKKKDY